MAASEGLLSTERGRNAKDVAEGGQASFEVELRGLCKVGVLTIVVEFEKCDTSFDLSLYHARRGNFKAALLDIGLAEGAEDGCPDFHDRAGLVTAQDKMAIV